MNKNLSKLNLVTGMKKVTSEIILVEIEIPFVEKLTSPLVTVIVICDKFSLTASGIVEIVANLSKSSFHTPSLQPLDVQSTEIVNLIKVTADLNFFP